MNKVSAEDSIIMMSLTENIQITFSQRYAICLMRNDTKSELKVKNHPKGHACLLIYNGLSFCDILSFRSEIMYI